jgi:hypothetical protein
MHLTRAHVCVATSACVCVRPCTTHVHTASVSDMFEVCVAFGRRRAKRRTRSVGLLRRGAAVVRGGTADARARVCMRTRIGTVCVRMCVCARHVCARVHVCLGAHVSAQTCEHFPSAQTVCGSARRRSPQRRGSTRKSPRGTPRRSRIWLPSLTTQLRGTKTSVLGTRRGLATWPRYAPLRHTLAVSCCRHGHALSIFNYEAPSISLPNL